MTHYSHVADSVFAKVQTGQRIIEPRLNDTAHQRIRIGDLIMFTNRKTHAHVVAKVVGKLHYKTFTELFATFPPTHFGAQNNDELLAEVRQWCSPQAEQQHGTLGIKLHLLK